jgi:hypothetical protein
MIGPINRTQQSGRLTQETRFLMVVDLPGELYAWAINKREYLVAEILFIDLVDLGCDL